MHMDRTLACEPCMDDRRASENRKRDRAREKKCDARERVKYRETGRKRSSNVVWQGEMIRQGDSDTAGALHQWFVQFILRSQQFIIRS